MSRSISHGIPQEFSPAAVAEAEAARPASMASREDWRDLPLITIDPADAKDHDDAVHAEPDADPANRGGHVVTVAIADVAAYVRPGSALDREALERGNSVYFPDRVVPMLPERISNDLCSLRPNEDRPALAVRMVLDADGRKMRHSFHRVMMRSAAKLAYAQAQAAIDGRTDETTAPLLERVLKPLWAAYAAAHKAPRQARAARSRPARAQDPAEAKDGTVDRVIVPRAARCAPADRGVHDPRQCRRRRDAGATKHAAALPRARRAFAGEARALGEFLALDRHQADAKGSVCGPSSSTASSTRVERHRAQPLINEVVLRTQAQAEYAAENYGHFGLNLRRYAHFTSPIRRYADLIVHRALIRALRLGKDGLPDSVIAASCRRSPRSISAAERRAMAAERETVDRLIAALPGRPDRREFEGRIAGVTRSGLFVRLPIRAPTASSLPVRSGRTISATTKPSMP